MKHSSIIRSAVFLSAFATMLVITSCKSLVQVVSPKPTDSNAQVNGYSLDAAGHYILTITFNNPMDAATVVVTKTLKLHFANDANAAASVTWSPDMMTATVTTIKTRAELNRFQPDDSFTMTLVGTDEGNGVVKSTSGDILDGDYNNTGGGNYVMGFTLIG